VVANAKNANACTGEPGLANARRMQQLAAQAAADQLNLPELTAEHFLVLSTGVIGQQMPMDKIATGIAAASQQLSSEGGLDAATAIMTTDTFAKHLAVQVQLQDGAGNHRRHGQRGRHDSPEYGDHVSLANHRCPD
jgi:glutamate N-acetyltransferase/amino-acid N-acetyltransferase